MTKYYDLTGQKFGRLAVISLLHKGHTLPNGTKLRKRWLCVCDCGVELSIETTNLTSGRQTSCGCSRIGNSCAAKIHGLSHTAEYAVWKAMHSRCENENNEHYQHYGARGIYVCERWFDFENFYADMCPRPSPDYTLERKENDGPYSPENCKWATRIEQGSNRRNTLNVEYRGEIKSVKVWCRELNKEYYVIRQRLIRDGWSPERALETPCGPFVETSKYILSKNK